MGEAHLYYMLTCCCDALLEGDECEVIGNAILQDKFTAVFMGLLRQRSLDFVGVYREEAIVTIKAIVKQVRGEKTTLVLFVYIC